jgi:hypothetical protein
VTEQEIINYADNAWGWCAGTVGGWPTYTRDELEHLTQAAMAVARPEGALVEVGVFSGKSLSVLLGVARDVGCWVVACDLMGWDPHLSEPFLRRVLADFSDVKWRFYPTSSRDCARYTTDVNAHRGDTILKPGMIDFLHVDGEHSEEAVVEDCGLFLPFMRSGGMAAFHDANPDPRAEAGESVIRGIERSCPGWETTWWSHQNNCLMIRRKP